MHKPLLRHRFQEFPNVCLGNFTRNREALADPIDNLCNSLPSLQALENQSSRYVETKQPALLDVEHYSAIVSVSGPYCRGDSIH